MRKIPFPPHPNSTTITPNSLYKKKEKYLLAHNMTDYWGYLKTAQLIPYNFFM